MSKERCDKHMDLVIILWEELGLLVESELIPHQVFVFVGIHYNLIPFIAHPTLENWIKVI